MNAPVLVGALEPELHLQAVHVLPEPEGLGDDTPLLAVVRKTTSWPSTVLPVTGSTPESRRTTWPCSSRTTSQRRRLMRSSDSPSRLACSASSTRASGASARAWSARWPSDRDERQRQRRRPDRIATNELQRPVRLVPALELGVVTRREQRLDAAPFWSSWTSSR